MDKTVSDIDLERIMRTRWWEFRNVDTEDMVLVCKELQSRRQSDLRVATKFLTNTYYSQMNRIRLEFNEVTEAAIAFIDTADISKHNLNHFAEELVDLQSTCETMLAILGLDEQQRRDVRKRVIAKNEARNYYEEAVR